MNDDDAARLLLAAQFTLLGLLALPDRSRRRGRPRRWQRVTGGILVLAGGALTGTGALALGPDLRPLPTPRPGVRLRRGGPYQWTRHPIYSGLLLGAAGRALASGGRRHVAAAAALAGVFGVKAHLEEKLLGAVVDYESYAQAVPRWGLRRRN